MNQAGDNQIVDRMAAGDRSALEELYDKYSGVLYGVVLRVLHSPTDSEDCLQEIWLEVWNRAASFDRKRGTVPAWLLTLARSRAIDRYRSRSSRSRIEEKAPPPDPGRSIDPSLAPELSQARDRVSSAMASLEDRHRRVLELAYWKGLSQSQIAREVDAPLGTVKSWIRQGLSQMLTRIPKEDWS